MCAIKACIAETGWNAFNIFAGNTVFKGDAHQMLHNAIRNLLNL